MNQERATGIEQPLARLVSIAKRARFATHVCGGMCGRQESSVPPTPATSLTACTIRTPCSSLRPGQLQAERYSDRTLDAQLLDRVLRPRAAIRVLNDWLNKLLWQSDGLYGLVAEGPGPLPGPLGEPGGRGGRQRPGPRDPRTQGRRLVNSVGMWAEPSAASGASAARPSQAGHRVGGGGRRTDLTEQAPDRTAP
jgi:hypothetical protein